MAANPPNSHFQVVIGPDPGGEGDRLHQQVGPAECVGGVDLLGAMARQLDLEVAGDRQQLATTVGHLGEDDDVGPGSREVAEEPAQIVGQVLAAVAADDQVDPVAGGEGRKGPGVGHAGLGVEGESDQSRGHHDQEKQDPNNPPLPAAKPPLPNRRGRRSRRWSKGSGRTHRSVRETRYPEAGGYRLSQG